MRIVVIYLSFSFLFSGCLPTRSAGMNLYLQSLKSQAIKQPMPPYFIKKFGASFNFDMSDVSYASDVDTLTSQVITYDRVIYFPSKVDFGNIEYIKAMLHELTHVQQQNAEKNFYLEIYVNQSLVSLFQGLTTKQLSVRSIHDNIGLEKEANANIENILRQTKFTCQNNLCFAAEKAASK